MNTKIDFRALTMTLIITLTVSYILCILGDLLFGWTMYQVWLPLLPGFTWPLSPEGFTIGLVWVIGYGIYLAALITFPYNFLVARKGNA
ncbi:MAG: hypothetical protein L3J16_01955 [Anaerolineales bacterium]|nr:hypothetical protein [Anaerolineales bacterium]